MPAPNTLFLRDFTVLDCAVAHPELGLQGESLLVSVELSGELDHQGFILDFGRAKKLLKQLVDDAMDHKLLVPESIASSGAGSSSGSISFAGFHYWAPSVATVTIPGKIVTIPAIAAELERRARALLPANVLGVRFELREEARFTTEANFRYTHGLRYHDGNCQRLFHGHRNPIEVWQNNQRQPEWEKILASEWDDAHFVAMPTLTNRAELDMPLGQRQKLHAGTAEIEYSAPQGKFRASLPASRVVLLEVEPSIENIARIGHERLRAMGMRGGFTVRAYEGLNKGAAFSLPALR